MQNISPLRYPGGKLKMFPQVQNIITSNNLQGCTYIEPFAGGAAVALALLFTEKASRIVINDLDDGIYSFWFSILHFHQEFIRLIIDTPITIVERDIQIIKYNNPKNILEKGFATFFLNRTNRSGIIHGGPIGGRAQDSDYKLDCRFNKKNLIDRINLIYTYREQIDLFNLDAKVFIDTIVKDYSKNSFIFFDPPYYLKGSELYFSYFKKNDHTELKNAIKEKMTDIPYIITYDDVKEINDLYLDFNSISYSLSYSAGKKGLGSEVLLYNPKLVTISNESFFFASKKSVSISSI